MTYKKPIIIVVGPTASGKSELAVRIAKKVNGEIISADSRQIYKGLDIGTGKISGAWHKSKIDGRQFLIYKYRDIIHYGIDIANPFKQYSAGQFQKYAEKIIANVYGRGKIPILCGGTGHWIDAVVFGQAFPEVKPNKKLRASLQKKTTAQLFAQLQQLDPDRAASIDRKNPRRLIRALEIVLSTGKTVPKLQQSSKYDVLWLGIKTDQKLLHKKIEQRLKQRLKAGMLDEIKTLHQQGIDSSKFPSPISRERVARAKLGTGEGLSWKRLESFGLEYKFGALYLQKKINKKEFIDQLSTAIKQYSKRQMTWWKRNKLIHWITI